jgi:23S rRNA (uracil1939-C5)-methyltransferase
MPPRPRHHGRRRDAAGTTRAAVPLDVAPLEVDLERFVAGGVALGREPGGRVVLAEGALPGERVVVELTVDKPTLARGVTTSVVRAAPGRVEPTCPEVDAGCGGCDLQHAEGGLQRQLKVEVVRDALARIGRLPDVEVGAGEHLPTADHRTVLRCAVHDGRAGLRRRRSAQVHELERCLVAHPLVEQLLSEGRFPGAEEVIVRVGARTGERMVVVSPGVGAASVPADVVLVGADELAAGREAWVHELVGRRRFRISAGSFFQARPDGAEAAIRAVGRALAPFDPTTDRLVDLYGGVGLFTAGLGARRSVLVERSTSSVRDAAVNLASLDAQVVQADVESWRPVPADVVVADPARAGLGAAGAAVVAGTGAARVALVSCDPAALARDARLLVDLGYTVEGVELVDMFPHTHHIEAVTSLRRRSGS